MPSATLPAPRQPRKVGHLPGRRPVQVPPVSREAVARDGEQPRCWPKADGDDAKQSEGVPRQRREAQWRWRLVPARYNVRAERTPEACRVSPTCDDIRIGARRAYAAGRRRSARARGYASTLQLSKDVRMRDSYL
jgi:hypothetical protein